MFAIALEEQQYKTYVLSDQTAQSQVEVVPERGGIVTRWSIQGQQIFYLDTERFTHPELSVRGGIPILFPICGNLVDNTYTYKGQSYTLKQHGFARDMPWEVTNQGIQDMASLTVVLRSDDRTRAVYPFDFEVAFTYQLKGNSLEIQQRYTNHSSEPMQFSTGLHPYFAVTDKTKLKLDIPATEFQDKQTQTNQAFNGEFDFNLDEIDVTFRQLSKPSATVTDPSSQRQLTVSYSDIYSTLVFWTVKGKDFYCLEPWSAPRNAFNTGDHLTRLDPGTSCETLIGFNITSIV